MTKPQPWWKEPTRKQWTAFTAAWLGWVLDAFDFTIYIVVARQISQEFGVSAVAIGGSLTLTLLVRLLGGFIAGWMADKWGRKLPLMLSLAWFAAFDAAIFFAPTFTWVLILRTMFGFGMGGQWTAGTSLAMESMPVRSRRFASGMLQAGWPIGYLLAATVAYFVVPAYGWRAMFLIAAVPALLAIPLFTLVPRELSQVANKPASRGALADLTAPGVRKMLVLGSLVMALGFIVYYGMITSYGPVHFEQAACGKVLSCLQATFSQLSLDTVWFNVGMLVGVVTAGWIAYRYSVIVALVVPALLMVPALPLFAGAVPSLMAVGAFLGGALGVGYSGVTPVLTTSLFPDHVRARAIGIVYHTGALLAAFVPTFIPWLAKSSGMTIALTMSIVVGSGLVVMAAAVLILRAYLTNPLHQRSQLPVEVARPSAATSSPVTEPAPTTGSGYDDQLPLPRPDAPARAVTRPTPTP